MLKKWLNAFLDLVYPPKCPSCRMEVELPGKWCEGCFEAIFENDRPKKISLAKHGIDHLDECLAVCNYQGIIKNLILDLKFKKNKRQGIKLTYILEKSLKDMYKSKVDIIVPVPLNIERMRERGFNQTEVIFKPWAEKEKSEWLDCLERIRPTRPQWRLTLKEREENIKGAFAMTRLFDSRPYVEGKSVLLVDDIFTSGKTMEECARILKAAKARRVFALALASGDW